MTAMKLHHVQVLCPAGGEEAARRFYGKLLGLRELRKPATLAADGVWFVLDDDRQLHVGVMRTGEQPARNRSHLALEVDDLDAILLRLRAAGHAWKNPPEVPGWQRIHTNDPFGNGIELLEIVDGTERLP